MRKVTLDFTRVKLWARIFVMPRPETRERLLDAAWQLAIDVGVPGLTLADVANRAGVSRQAVYLHFGNRSTLLVEMARRVDRTSGFRFRLAEARKLPAGEAFIQVLVYWYDYIPTILPVHLALEAAALTGSEGAAAYADRMNDWHEGLHIDITRLDEEGILNEGWSINEAADWTWAQVHPTTYHHLVNERGWSPETVSTRTIEGLSRELLDRR